MSERAQTLTREFEQAHEQVVQTVERCPDQQWQANCREGWTVAATADHIAEGYDFCKQMTQMMANGDPLPAIPMNALHEGNRQHAEQYANCSKQETLDALRSRAEQLAGFLRGLSDEQLQRRGQFFGMDMTTEQFIQNIAIGHPREHLQSIQGALSA